MKFLSLLAALSMVLALSSCGKKNISSAWDRDVKNPLLDSNPQRDERGAISTAFCRLDPNGAYSTKVGGVEARYSDAVNVANGHRDDYDFGEGGACVNRPIREVLAAAQNQEFFHWEGTTNFALRSVESPDPLTKHYVYTYHVSNPFPLPNVDWTMDWFYSVVKGTLEQPEQVVISYKKIEGTKYIRKWEGSITLDYVSDTITSIAASDHADATQQDSKDAEATVRTIIEKARSQAPNWDAIGGEKPGQGEQPEKPAPSKPSLAYCKPDSMGFYEGLQEDGSVQRFGETLVITKGFDEKGGFHFANGGGCLPESLETVWQHTQEQPFFLWPRVSKLDLSEVAAFPGMVKSFRSQYQVSSFLPFLNVDWTMFWNHAVSSGNAELPKQIVITYQKTEGSSRIKQWEGTVTLDALAPNLTGVAISDHLKATWQNEGTVEKNLLHLRDFLKGANR